MVLTKMKEFAVAYLAKNIKSAVIMALPYFSNAQRHATNDVGINILKIIMSQLLSLLLLVLIVNILKRRTFSSLISAEVLFMFAF